MPAKRQYHSEEPSRPDFVGWIQRAENHFGRFAFDAGGVILFAFALMTLLALLGLTGGSLLTPWSITLWRWMGYGSLFIVIAAGLGGLMLLRKRASTEGKIHWGRIIGLEMAAFCAMVLFAIIGGSSIERAESGLDGGYIGWALAQLLSRIFGDIWRDLLIVLALLIFMVIGFDLIPKFEILLWKIAGDAPPTPPDNFLAIPETKIHPVVDSNSPAPVSPPKKVAAPLPVEFRKNFKVDEAQNEKPASPQPRSDRLPPFSMLLGEQASRPDERQINLTAGLIEKTLSEFGIPAKVVGFRIGPTVTQFAVQPGFIKKPGSNEDDPQQMKVRVAQIASL
ncbi:MAG: DNA translocase FtsK, partial [Chloroflexi bacterium]|nr:DNA translocase FtsK [Chloroflexota bacterium]